MNKWKPLPDPELDNAISRWVDQLVLIALLIGGCINLYILIQLAYMYVTK